MATKSNILKYDPKYCELIVELGKAGASQKTMWSNIGISKTTAATWQKNHPEFEEAVSRATTESQAYWEREGLANLNNRTYNVRLFEIMTKSLFPADYREVKENKVDVKAEVTIDFGGEVAKLISALKESK
jgi:transposase